MRICDTYVPEASIESAHYLYQASVGHATKTNMAPKKSVEPPETANSASRCEVSMRKYIITGRTIVITITIRIMLTIFIIIIIIIINQRLTVFLLVVWNRISHNSNPLDRSL